VEVYSTNRHTVRPTLKLLVVHATEYSQRLVLTVVVSGFNRRFRPLGAGMELPGSMGVRPGYHFDLEATITCYY